MDACVNVNGSTRLTRGPGTIRKKNHWNHHPMRRGRISIGTRHIKEMNEDKHTVPKTELYVCDTAARTIVLDGVFGGMACRWKYHCDTVAAVVALSLADSYSVEPLEP